MNQDRSARLPSCLILYNPLPGHSGADAPVRARPPGRALALIVNSYGGRHLMMGSYQSW
ncbi:hypothetical protein SBA4_4100012 [Candidatus Sulfopaludibacter sp. SbA4]|nr:hypothetical protein SBA4_4100012 [Candidatus Sulfopaludibacter sp. SbA4]